MFDRTRQPKLSKHRKHNQLPMSLATLCVCTFLGFMGLTCLLESAGTTPGGHALSAGDTMICIGDSVTAASQSSLDGGYVQMLRDAYPSATVINAGHSGYTSQNLISVASSAAQTYRPKIATIMCGINDIQLPGWMKPMWTVDVYLDNINQMVQAIRSASPGCRVILLTQTPITKGGFRSWPPLGGVPSYGTGMLNNGWLTIQLQWNTALKSWAASHGVECVDVAGTPPSGTYYSHTAGTGPMFGDWWAYCEARWSQWDHFHESSANTPLHDYMLLPGDDLHVNLHAHTIIFQTLYAYLEGSAPPEPRPNTSPKTSMPADQSWTFGTATRSITWTVTDAEQSTGRYAVYCNGSLRGTGTWTNGTAISYRLAQEAGCDFISLRPGRWSITIQASDGVSGSANATDTIIVEVLAPGQQPEPQPEPGPQVEPTPDQNVTVNPATNPFILNLAGIVVEGPTMVNVTLAAAVDAWYENATGILHVRNGAGDGG
jgi:lysophospholipase L1-like esterase